ncbi:MAG TPA: MmgE/PrpD family protein [Rhodopila sp.]|uniref:MmgE/PrpD family protein n=1 Tax=Rhodopila sp. TaxID=2480087 RepID=UPI002B6226CE|nr:MmgE/PrpD family protein [Rhodopila sp.]HVY15439.1 MmgE/PrpD family protein [Rhodopila sp.]
MTGRVTGGDPTGAMAEWVAAPGRAWSARCRAGARLAFLDTLAVILAGRDEPATAALAPVAGKWGAGPAWTVVGARLPAPWAALLNGTAAHALDWDDVLDPAMNHPSAALVPALLALGEQEGASGPACLDAYLTGFEIMARLGEAMNLAHYHRGWHTTLSLGATGVAAACARLLGLSAEAARHAIGLSISMAGGSKRQFGSMAKPLHAGLAAKNGLLAAELAAAGVTAAAEVFEGAWGYVEMTTGAGAPGFASVLPRFGDPPAMAQYGVWTKLYPCCASTHRPVDAMRALAAEHRFGAADLEDAACWVSAVSNANLRFADPASPSEARFSLQYTVAAALTDGTLTMDSFTPAQIARPAVRALFPRIRMLVDPALPGDTHAAESREAARVMVRLRDGRQLEHHVIDPRGHPGDPANEAELEDKFRLAAAGALGGARTDAALDMIRHLPMLPSLAPLTAILNR